MTDHRLEDATLTHAVAMAPRVTDACRAEAEALYEADALTGLRKCLMASRKPISWLVDGQPIAMFGVAQFTPFSVVGWPWIMNTPELKCYRMRFLRASRRWIDISLEDWPRLETLVDSRRPDAVEWLVWLGFNFGPLVKIGPGKIPFYLADKDRD